MYCTQAPQHASPSCLRAAVDALYLNCNLTILAPASLPVALCPLPSFPRRPFLVIYAYTLRPNLHRLGHCVVVSALRGVSLLSPVRTVIFVVDINASGW